MSGIGGSPPFRPVLLADAHALDAGWTGREPYQNGQTLGTDRGDLLTVRVEGGVTAVVTAQGRAYVVPSRVSGDRDRMRAWVMRCIDSHAIELGPAAGQAARKPPTPAQIGRGLLDLAQKVPIPGLGLNARQLGQAVGGATRAVRKATAGTSPTSETPTSETQTSRTQTSETQTSRTQTSRTRTLAAQTPAPQKRPAPELHPYSATIAGGEFEAVPVPKASPRDPQMWSVTWQGGRDEGIVGAQLRLSRQFGDRDLGPGSYAKRLVVEHVAKTTKSQQAAEPAAPAPVASSNPVGSSTGPQRAAVVRLDLFDTALGLAAGKPQGAAWLLHKGIDLLAKPFDNPLFWPLGQRPAADPLQARVHDMRAPLAFYELTRAGVPIDGQGRFDWSDDERGGEGFAALVAAAGEAGDASLANVSEVAGRMPALKARYGLSDAFVRGFERARGTMTASKAMDTLATLSSLGELHKGRSGRPAAEHGPHGPLDVVAGAPTKTAVNDPRPVEVRQVLPPKGPPKAEPSVDPGTAGHGLSPLPFEAEFTPKPRRLPPSRPASSPAPALTDDRTIDVTPISTETVAPIRRLRSEEMNRSTGNRLTNPLVRQAVIVPPRTTPHRATKNTTNAAKGPLVPPPGGTPLPGSTGAGKPMTAPGGSTTSEVARIPPRSAIVHIDPRSPYVQDKWRHLGKHLPIEFLDQKLNPDPGHRFISREPDGIDPFSESTDQDDFVEKVKALRPIEREILDMIDTYAEDLSRALVSEKPFPNELLNEFGLSKTELDRLLTTIVSKFLPTTEKSSVQIAQKAVSIAIRASQADLLNDDGTFIADILREIDERDEEDEWINLKGTTTALHPDALSDSQTSKIVTELKRRFGAAGRPVPTIKEIARNLGSTSTVSAYLMNLCGYTSKEIAAAVNVKSASVDSLIARTDSWLRSRNFPHDEDVRLVVDMPLRSEKSLSPAAERLREKYKKVSAEKRIDALYLSSYGIRQGFSPDVVSEAATALSVRQIQTLGLYGLGLSRAAISGILGIKSGAVNLHLSQAVHRIRKRAGDESISLSAAPGEALRLKMLGRNVPESIRAKIAGVANTNGPNRSLDDRRVFLDRHRHENALSSLQQFLSNDDVKFPIEARKALVIALEEFESRTRSGQIDSRLLSLTTRQLQVGMLAVLGFNDVRIRQILGLSHKQTYISDQLRLLYSAAGLHSRSELIRWGWTGSINPTDSTHRSPLGLVRPSTSAHLSKLSNDERTIVQMLAEGQSDAEVAARLGVAVRTLERRLTSLMEKVQVSDRLGLASFYFGGDRPWLMRLPRESRESIDNPP